MQVIEMFSASEMASLVMTIEEKIEKAKQSISRLFDAGQPAVVAYSAGKGISTSI